MSLGLVRQCCAFSAVYRKPGSHVQKNLLAQAKGEEMLQEGAQCKNMGHFKAGKQALKSVVEWSDEGDHIQQKNSID